MIKFDVILWRILAVTGLNFLNYRFGPKEKYFRLFFMIVYVLSRHIYQQLNYISCDSRDSKNQSLHFQYVFYSGLQWYFSYTRRTAISYMVSQVYRFKKHYSASKRTFYYTLIALIIIIPTLEFIICIHYQIVGNFEKLDFHFWTFGFDIHDKTWKRILLFYLQFADFAFCFIFIFFLTFCVCILFHRCNVI